MRCVRATIVAVEKRQEITYSDGVSITSVMHHEERMRRVILSSVASPALQHFSTLSHKSRDYRRKKCY